MQGQQSSGRGSSQLSISIVNTNSMVEVNNINNQEFNNEK